MTHEEATKELEWIYQNGFENDIKIIGTDRILDAIRMGIEALDKQIPKKPIVRNYASWSACSCGMKIYDPFSYCPYCGQAIDWEVKK